MTIPAMAKDNKEPRKKMSEEEWAKKEAEMRAYMAKDRELVKASLASAARNGGPMFSDR